MSETIKSNGVHRVDKERRKQLSRGRFERSNVLSRYNVNNNREGSENCKLRNDEQKAWGDLLGDFGLFDSRPKKMEILGKVDPIEVHLRKDNDELNLYDGLEKMYKTLEAKNWEGSDIRVEEFRPPNVRGDLTKTNRTYGEQRSFLMGAKEDTGEKKERFRGSVGETVDTSSVHGPETLGAVDLRNLGRRNLIKEEVEYLLDGICFIRDDELNRVLVSSLLDLRNYGDILLEAQLFSVAERLETILQQLLPSKKNQEKFISFLVQQNILWLIEQDKNVTDVLSTGTLNALFEKICFDHDNLVLLKHSRQQLQHVVNSASKVVPFVMLRDNGRIYNEKLFAMKRLHPEENLQYIENYFQRNPQTEIHHLQPVLHKAMRNMDNNIVTDFEVTVVKLLVMTSTNGNQYYPEYINPLLRIILRNYDALKEGHSTPIVMDAALLSMGYIINVLDHIEIVSTDTLALIQETYTHLVRLIPDSEFLLHLLGYNSVILSLCLEDLSVSKDLIISHLDAFYDAIDKSVFKERVSLIVHLLKKGQSLSL